MSIQLLRLLKLQLRKVLRKVTQPSTTDKNARYHKHTPGDGLHLINDTASRLPDGTMQKGEVSDICIVTVAHGLCTAFGLPPIWLLWSEAYPDDPMDENDFEMIKESAEPYLNEFDPFQPETRAAIISDLRAISCGKLAAEIEKLLSPFDQVEKLLVEKRTPSE